MASLNVTCPRFWFFHMVTITNRMHLSDFDGCLHYFVNNTIVNVLQSHNTGQHMFMLGITLQNCQLLLLTCLVQVQIIPQSVSSPPGLAIGEAVAPIVRVLLWICFPVAHPISKVLVSSNFLSQSCILL